VDVTKSVLHDTYSRVKVKEEEEMDLAAEEDDKWSLMTTRTRADFYFDIPALASLRYSSKWRVMASTVTACGMSCFGWDSMATV